LVEPPTFPVTALNIRRGRFHMKPHISVSK
jgi:hypothetical protein